MFSSHKNGSEVQNGSLVDTESRRVEANWVDDFLSIVRLFHPQDANGEDRFPISSDGVPYSASKLLS